MRQLAQVVGISNPYLSQIERGLREPSEKVLEAIAEGLQTNVEALYAQAGYAPAGDEDDEEPAVTAASPNIRRNIAAWRSGSRTASSTRATEVAPFGWACHSGRQTCCGVRCSHQ